MNRKPAPRIHEPADSRHQPLRPYLPWLFLLPVLFLLWLAYPLLRPQAPPQDNAPPAAPQPPAMAVAASVPEQVQPPALHRSGPPDDRRPLDRYPLAHSTWGDTLNPGGSVPARGYAAYYINRQQPQQIVAQENVDSIAMNYNYNEFHGIPSEQFGAYWVGRLHVPHKALYRVSGDLSWSQMRVLLDKHILIEGDRGTSLELDAGDYLLEVEYLNNWHTTNFQFAITPAVSALDDDGLRAAIAAQKLPAGTVAYAVGVYESDSRDNRILLHAPTGDAPYILLLGSYRAVQWEISGRAPALVIYNGAWHGSSVRSDGGNIPLLAWKGGIAHDLDARKATECYCHGGHFHCEGHRSSLGGFAAEVKTLTGFPLAGVSGKYSASAFNIPETPVNTDTVAAGAQVQADIEAQRRACIGKSEAGFEDIMK
ncbi:hypothetical protein [uncultured Cardiobacterium sp.]|uniref:hypothetical protein n=1 Tax=uncultured Cardiobacterium sp. TaxID=417619 RepID=UPI00261EA17C|nr:hypothetical protein [uncultured Cardiobacterium sp.]